MRLLGRIRIPVKRKKTQEADGLLCFWTVDKPMRHSIDTHGGIVKGGGYAPLHVQAKKKWELFLEVHIFAFKLSTLCRQLETQEADGLLRFWAKDLNDGSFPVPVHHGFDPSLKKDPTELPIPSQT